MPKVKWIREPEQPVNRLAALFRAYRRSRGMSAAELAEAMGCSEQAVRQLMSRPPAEWRIGQIQRFCEALGVPIEEALMEVMRS